MSKIYKNSGVRYWKDYFNDLNPFDEIHLDDMLDRFKKTLKSFEFDKPNYTPGNLFKEYQGNFFIPILKREHLKVSGLRRLHEKFNHPSCVVNDEMDPRGISYTGQKRIAFPGYGNSPYRRDDFYDKPPLKGNCHQNFKDGMIRPGLNISNWHEIMKNVENKKLTENFIYLEIPHEIITEHMQLNHNNLNLKIPKQFVEEVESKDPNWDDTERTNRIIRKYDEKYSGWNFDFPIFGYTSIKKFGLLMPTFYFWGRIFRNGTHRVYNASLSKSDFPTFVNIPSLETERIIEEEKMKIIDGDKEFVIATGQSMTKMNGNYSRLLCQVNRTEKNVKYYLSSKFCGDRDNTVDPNSNRKLIHFNDVEKVYIGESKF
tara:strand:+ start:1885 stop:3000 length:1116 start_codon:yes stop_codon:yes gene_type:complete